VGSKVRSILTAVSFITAQVLVGWVTMGPVLGQPWLTGFRDYFSNDQLSYAAIARTVADGGPLFTEPFTQAGGLFYPSGWYQALGLIGRVTGVHVWTLWQVLGALVVALAVFVVGFSAWRLSTRWWAPLLPGVLLLSGTTSVLRDDYWYSSLDGHAVLWGPFGALFTLNGEVIGLSIAAISISLLMLLVLRPNRPSRTQYALAVGAGALCGVVANVQTYSFFTVLTLVAFWGAAYGLLRARSRGRALITAGLVAVVLATGPAVAARAGQLAVLVLLLLALAPAAWPLVRARPGLALSFLGSLALTASPQVLRTAWGLVHHDAFLVYRVASTDNLGVPLVAGVVAALVPLTLLVACLLAPRSSRGPWITAALLGWLAAALAMTTNDRWGFTQEPYRFWIDFFIVGVMLLSIVIPVIAAHAKGALPWLPSAIALGVAVLVYALALADVRGFAAFARDQGIVDFASPRMVALQKLTAGRAGLYYAGPCLDPQHLRLASGQRVAFFNLGMAWPDDHARISTLISQRAAGVADPAAIRDAGVEWLITESGCDTLWQFAPSDRITPETVEGDFTLWRVSR
jgi:hypothetical protein